MIRINLLPVLEKRKKAASRAQLYIFVSILAVEVLFLFIWYQKTSSDLTEVEDKLKDLVKKTENLEKVKKAWEEWEKEKVELQKQIKIFEDLKSEQLGPPSMFQFLSYVLSPHDEEEEKNLEEIKSLELAGWNLKWNPSRVWVKKFKEIDGVVTIEGDALDHEDVAEFYRRLETGGYFVEVEPGLQMQKFDKTLDLKYIEFKGTAILSYNVDAEKSETEPGAPPQ
ncbi:MAG: PilN domain-containing protein [Deltaproteobacteria bacterium]|nr:PilN domain-containing protein [Deltaproteobacteria bacterium]